MSDERRKETTSASTSAAASPVSGAMGEGVPCGVASGSGAEASAEEIEELRDLWFGLEFTVHKSLRYHAKRRAFFDTLHRGAQAITAIAASAAFADIVNNSPGWIATIGAGLLALTAALDLVIGFSSHARQHDTLYRQYSDLAEEMAVVDQPTGGDMRTFKAKRLRLEKDEPTNIDALNVLCHNEECESRALSNFYEVGFLKRVFANFFTFPPNNFPPKAPL